MEEYGNRMKRMGHELLLSKPPPLQGLKGRLDPGLAIELCLATANCQAEIHPQIDLAWRLWTHCGVLQLCSCLTGSRARAKQRMSLTADTLWPSALRCPPKHFVDVSSSTFAQILFHLHS